MMPGPSRRTLLVASSAFVAAATLKPTALWAASPRPDGRINLGLNGIAYYALTFPFINVWKCAGQIEITAGKTVYKSLVTPGAMHSAWDGFLDSDGELISPLPFNVSMTRVFYAPPVDGLPAGYSRIGHRWVLKWDGAARGVSIPATGSMTRRDNRVLFSWSSDTTNMWVTFADIDRHNPPRNIRLCELRHEERLDAGEIFNPDWLSEVRAGSGIVRFMDWQHTNFNLSTLRTSDIPGPKHYSYGGITRKPFIKGGMPLSIMSALANEVRSHPWVCVPNVLGTAKLSSIQTITNAHPAVVHSEGHRWDDGDDVIPYGTNWPQIERKRFKVASADRRAGTFALAGVDSANFPPYKSGWAAVTSVYDLDGMAQEIAQLAAHFRDSVAPGLVTYYEFGNEVWNFAFNAPHWLAAQALVKFGRDDNNRMAGYLGAHCMRVIRELYGSMGRTRWRGVMATQTVNPDVTRRMLAGAKQYIDEHASSLRLSDLFGDLAVAGYFGGNFGHPQKDMIFAWMDESEKRWRDGLEATKYSYFNRIENEDLSDGRHTKIPWSLDKIKGFWRAQKVLADAAGLGLIQYEGGNGNYPIFFNNLSPAQRTRLMEFYKQSCHTAEDARNYTAMFEAFVAMGGEYPSKFVESGPVSRYGNWGALRYPGDSNPVWDAVKVFNRRS